MPNPSSYDSTCLPSNNIELMFKDLKYENDEVKHFFSNNYGILIYFTVGQTYLITFSVSS